MSNVKTYQVVINGLKESIDAVDSLNKQLDTLEKRINDLQGKGVSISSKGGGKTSEELSAQEQLQKQILANEKKIEIARDDDYKILLRQKQLLKDIATEQKAVVASEKIASPDNYNLNTVQGIKDRLRDLKAAMQTTDLGDVDALKKLTNEANELNNKLKEIEQSYGVFSRSVGHYENAAEGFKGLKLDIGGMTQEFDNAKQALMTLKKEMQTLATKKDLGIITDEESERLKSLIPTVKQLESSIADAGKPMDALMDTMQSFVALAQTGKGLAAFFGIDGTGIDESIKNLVALQNAMQGLQTIQKQLQTEEGLGKYFKKGSAEVDKFVAKLTGAKVGMNGLTMSTKTATIAVRGLSMVLKAIGIGLFIEGLSLAIEGIKTLVSSLSSASDEEKKLAEQTKTIGDAGAEAFAKANAEMAKYKQTLEDFNGTQEQEKKLVDELNKKYGDALGQYKSIAEWKQILIDKGEAYVESLRKEAEAQAMFEIYVETYKEYLQELDKIKSGEYNSIWSTHAQDVKRNAEKEAEALNVLNRVWEQYLGKIREIDVFNQTHQIFGYSTGGTVSSSSNRSGVNATKKAEENINQMRIRVMREGLTKTIAQYTLERNKRLEEVRKNGIRIGEQELLINREYQQKVLNARLQYHQKLLKEQEEFLNSQSELQKGNEEKAVAWERNAYDRRLQIAIDALRKYPDAYKKELKNFDDLDSWKIVSAEQDEWLTNELNKSYFVSLKDTEDTITDLLKNALDDRLDARKEYYEEIETLQRKNTEKQLDIQKEHLDATLESDLKAEEKRFAELVGKYDEENKKLAKVFRFNENAEQSNIATENPIQTALDAYSNGIFVGKTKEEIGKELQEQIEGVEEFVNEVKYAFEDGLISFEEYNNTMQSTFLQTFIKSKDDYENFLDKYDKMSSEERAANLGELNMYQGLYYESFVQFLDDLRSAQETHDNTMRTIQNEHDEAVKQAEFISYKEIQSNANEYFSNMINEYDRGYNAILKTVEQFQTQNRASSEFGFINLKKLNKNLNKAADLINKNLGRIDELRSVLDAKVKSGEISEEDYSNQVDSLNNLENNYEEVLSNINQKGKEGVENLVQTINNYIQVLGQSIQTVMSSLDDYADYQLDKEQEDLDKENDLLQEKLSEQEEIIQKHSDKVNDIEDELSTARGDRRQYLIDQLNSEIAAQRAAEAERQRIEREQAALEKKQEALDKKREIQDYNRKLRDILVSGALAVSNAFATSPFVPVGLAMGALATSLTAFQYAMAKKQKPYAKGGLLEGPSHKEGGIPVGNTGIEVEGKEYVVRKKSTANNIPVLDFINKSERKLTLSDFIDFYSSKPRTTIKKIRSKFADGGTLPTNIDISESLDRNIIIRDDSVYQVSVVDINRQQENLKNVQVLAGLN